MQTGRTRVRGSDPDGASSRWATVLRFPPHRRSTR